MGMPDFDNERVKKILSENNLTEADVRSVYPAWASIAEMLGPEGCKELKIWITKRRHTSNAIEEIKNQPFYSRRTE